MHSATAAAHHHHGAERTGQRAAASAAQAWAILQRHAREEIGPLRLQELCSDNDRVSSLVAVHNSQNRILLADLSRQRMTLETLQHLLRLASARNVRGFVRRLAWGQNDPDDPLSARSGGSTTHGPRPTSSPLKKSLLPASLDSVSASQSMHLALRAPADSGLVMLTSDGANALDGIHAERRRIHQWSNNVRRGVIRGASGAVLRDVVVVGRGVAVAALQFLYEALRRDQDAVRLDQEDVTVSGSGGVFPQTLLQQKGGHSNKIHQGVSRRMRFVTSIDPVAVQDAVSDLKPGSTMVVSVSIMGDEETGLSTRALRKWLTGHHKKSEHAGILDRHMILITADDWARQKFNKSSPSKNNNNNTNNNGNGKHGDLDHSVYVLPQHSRCEPFTTFTAAGLVPLALVFGWKVVEHVLAGAHDLDRHFVETNPRHSLPVLLALVDVWNDAFLEPAAGRMITPFAESFKGYPNFVAALESQTSGAGRRVGVVVGGGSCGSVRGGSGEYDRLLYQGGRVTPSELIMAMDTQSASDSEEDRTHHDALTCSFFAHADVLAFGNHHHRNNNNNGSVNHQHNKDKEEWGRTSHAAFPAHATSSLLDRGNGGSDTVAEGNRPSTLLMCGRCDAFTCGQLVALAEHRAVVRARLWDVDPFAARKRVGSSLRSDETRQLRGRLQRLHDKVRREGGRHRDDGAGSDGDDDDSSSDGSDDGTGSHDDDEDDEGGRMNLATSTILTHYATRMRDQRSRER